MDGIVILKEATSVRKGEELLVLISSDSSLKEDQQSAHQQQNRATRCVNNW